MKILKNKMIKLNNDKMWKATTKNANYIITDSFICYYNENKYTSKETIEFLKSKGHKECSLERAIELVTEWNNSMKLKEDEEYEEYSEFIAEQKSAGYSIVGNFFQPSSGIQYLEIEENIKE